MDKVKQTVLKTAAKMAKEAARASNGKQSLVWSFEPKAPESVKKMK